VISLQFHVIHFIFSWLETFQFGFILSKIKKKRKNNKQMTAFNNEKWAWLVGK
jgi:hypothetical protein